MDSKSSFVGLVTATRTPSVGPSLLTGSPPSLAEEVDRLARQLSKRHFPEAAQGLRAATARMLVRWRERSLVAMPELDRLTIEEFENSVATLIDALAGAMECRDPSRVRRIIAESPAHGVMRFAQQCSAPMLLAEERILRSVIVLELRRELGRPLTAEEAAALHELLDLMGEYSLLALINAQGDARDRVIQSRVRGLHRLADMGTLVAGVAHDAAKMLLPLHMRLEHLKNAELSIDVREDVRSIELIVKQFQNSIVNLRWLSIDSAGGRPGAAAHKHDGVSLRLSEWAAEAGDFHRRMLRPGVELRFDVPAELPAVGISSAALSQAVFNLIHNSHQAITSAGRPGKILVRGGPGVGGGIDLTVEDDGPGMSPEVLRRSTEPFFTTRESGSGLGLALVQALVEGSGGALTIHSPPPGGGRGTAAVLSLPLARP